MGGHFTSRCLSNTKSQSQSQDSLLPSFTSLKPSASFRANVLPVLDGEAAANALLGDEEIFPVRGLLYRVRKSGMAKLQQPSRMLLL